MGIHWSISHALQVTNSKPQQTHQSQLERPSNELFTVCTYTVCMQDGEWTSSTVCWSCVSGLEVFVINSGVGVVLIAEKLNSSSGEQETDTAINLPHPTQLQM